VGVVLLGFQRLHGASLLLTRSRRPEVFELSDPYRSFIKAGNDVELAAHRLDVGTKRTYIHIRAAFKLRNRRLVDLERLGQLRLRCLPGSPDFLESHRCHHPPSQRAGTRPSRRCHLRLQNLECLNHRSISLCGLLSSVEQDARRTIDLPNEQTFCTSDRLRPSCRPEAGSLSAADRTHTTLGRVRRRIARATPAFLDAVKSRSWSSMGGRDSDPALKQNHPGVNAHLLLFSKLLPPSFKLVGELDAPFHWRTITPMELTRKCGAGLSGGTGSAAAQPGNARRSAMTQPACCIHSTSTPRGADLHSNSR